MTTICWDGRKLAADTRYIEGDSFHGYCRKIIMLNDGKILAVSGEIGYLKTLGDAIEAGKTWGETLSRKEMAKFGALLYDPDADVMYYFDASHKGFIPLATRKTAIGAGAEIAMAFMRQNYTAKNAVRAVSKVHVTTNNIIDIYDSETKELTLAPLPE